MRASGPLLPALALSLVSACAGARGGGPDPSPPSRDVVVADAGPGGGDQAYVYVARRPLGVVALAEARGLDADVARAAIDRLADELDACATTEGRRGALVPGAARLVAQIDDDGRLAGASLRVDPGAGAAENAAVCLVAPARMLTFPPSDAGARGIAIEALWGSVQGR